MTTVTLTLPQFEGPLELLFALVQKDEIDICSLSLNELILQISNCLETAKLDLGAESIGHASHLLLLKSRALLPQSHVEEPLNEDGSDLKKALLQKLVEYCRFKDAASALALKEERAKESYLRPISHPEALKKHSGLEHVTLQELAAVFQVVLEKARDSKGIIEEEPWSVSDKMQIILSEIRSCKKMQFEELFSSNYTKLELIVIFLAVLELMKLGELRVVKEKNTLMIMDYGKRD